MTGLSCSSRAWHRRQITNTFISVTLSCASTMTGLSCSSRTWHRRRHVSVNRNNQYPDSPEYCFQPETYTNWNKQYENGSYIYCLHCLKYVQLIGNKVINSSLVFVYKINMIYYQNNCITRLNYLLLLNLICKYSYLLTHLKIKVWN